MPSHLPSHHSPTHSITRTSTHLPSYLSTQPTYATTHQTNNIPIYPSTHLSAQLPAHNICIYLQIYTPAKLPTLETYTPTFSVHPSINPSINPPSIHQSVNAGSSLYTCSFQEVFSILGIRYITICSSMLLGIKHSCFYTIHEDGFSEEIVDSAGILNLLRIHYIRANVLDAIA